MYEGGGVFNGVHLRLEDDVRGCIESEGGLEIMKMRYAEALVRLGFNNTTPLYVASGL